MFVDQITINARAGNGGNGVERWRHEKFIAKAGPAGGNGGNGGDVYIESVRDLGLLAKYTGSPEFEAEDGQSGQSGSKYGHNGKDIVIKVPVGSIVTDIKRNRQYEFFKDGIKECILKGGQGGFGNEHFKSSVNRSPKEVTAGKIGESGELKIELTLVVDVGLIGMPNAGKSSLLNNLTNAHSAIGAYPFTTLTPHLGDFYGYVIADIPGLIEGAASGKGLGHTFLRHVTKTKMLLHLVSLEHDDPVKEYYTILNELSSYHKSLVEKEEWIIFTKKDLVNQVKIDALKNFIDKSGKRVFIVSMEAAEGIKNLSDALVQYLRES